ncbi:MAG: MmgE/PrpD family protein [bacterium]|nr:MmgE/PrpD family protein [bacterium]
MTTVAEHLADFTARVRYTDLSPEAIHQVKRFLWDSLGCAFGGLDTRDAAILRAFTAELGGPADSTVIGWGDRAPAVHTSLMNALLMRALDYNDIYWNQDPSHPSDLIPAALSAGEARGRSGKELILGIALAYEFEMRLCQAAIPGIRERKWHHASLTAFASPLVAGKMLNLNAEQLTHATGISASHSMTLGCVTAGKLTMMKNTVDPLATQSGVVAALLAEKGYQGPAHVIDGKEGLTQCLGPEWDLARLTDGLGSDWQILHCGMKAFPTEALTHAPISGVLGLVTENDLSPAQIARVDIDTLSKAADILSDPSKYHPTTRETADHSLPYCLAAAIVLRRVTPDIFGDEYLFDATIRETLPKIKVRAEPTFEKQFPKVQPCNVTITLTDGRKLSRHLDWPKGDPRSPMSEDEIDGKVSSLMRGKLSDSARATLRDLVFHLEDVAAVGELMAATRCDLA